MQHDRYGNKRIEPSAKQLSLPSVHLTYQESVYDKNVQSSGALPKHEHHTCKITMQAQAPLDSCTEGPAIPSSSSAREDAGTSSSSPRKDNFGHPPYGFIPVPIPVAAAIPYHYSSIMPPIYYTQPPFMQCDPSGINQMGIQHAYHSSYHQNLGKPSEIDEHRQLEENQRLHHSRQILQESGDPIDLLRAHAEHNNQSASCSQDIRGWTVSGETDTNTNAIIAPESGNESGIQNFGYNGLDSDRSRREAALMKFRMKRKDRCFEKKVFCLLNLNSPQIHKSSMRIHKFFCANTCFFLRYSLLSSTFRSTGQISQQEEACRAKTKNQRAVCEPKTQVSYNNGRCGNRLVMLLIHDCTFDTLLPR